MLNFTSTCPEQRRNVLELLTPFFRASGKGGRALSLLKPHLIISIFHYSLDIRHRPSDFYNI